MSHKLLPVFSFLMKSRKLRAICNALGDPRFLLSILPTLWLVVFFVFSFLIIVKTSFSEAILGIPPFSEIYSWTADNLLEIKLNIQNYIVILKDSYYVNAFVNSIYLNIISTTLCCGLGFVMAYGIYNSRANLRGPLLFLVSLSFWTSFLIRVYAWINMLSAHGIINSFLIKIGLIDLPIHFTGNYYAVCVGLVFCYLPFAIFPMYSTLDKIDRSCMEAANDLGCGLVRTFWTVLVPLSRRGMISGYFMVFAASFGDFVIPELLGGSDTLTFGRILWIEFFNNLDWPVACAISVIMMVIVALPIFLLGSKSIALR
ncbi:MAG: ABC transporter permease subunit [Holosporales bacterium]|nr:ABC transporter permease subunit [Holosporales bacterium]